MPSLRWFRADVELLENGASQAVIVAMRCPDRSRGRLQRGGAVSHTSIARGSVTKMKRVDRVSGAA